MSNYIVNYCHHLGGAFLECAFACVKVAALTAPVLSCHHHPRHLPLAWSPEVQESWAFGRCLLPFVNAGMCSLAQYRPTMSAMLKPHSANTTSPCDKWSRMPLNSVMCLSGVLPPQTSEISDQPLGAYSYEVLGCVTTLILSISLTPWL